MEQALHAPQFLVRRRLSGDCSPLEGTFSYKLTSLNDQGDHGRHASAKSSRPARRRVRHDLLGPDSGATGYRIYRGADGIGPVPSRDGGGRSHQLVDDGLAVPDGTPPPTVNTAHTPGEWHPTFGGFIPEVSKGPGYYRDLKDVGGTRRAIELGCAATGLPLAAA